MSIWASLGDDTLCSLPNRSEYGEPADGDQCVDVATSGMSSAIRLLAEAPYESARLYLSPDEARELARRLVTAADHVEATP